MGDEAYEICAALFAELDRAGFQWYEYPTLIDAIERVVSNAILKAHQEHWSFSEAARG